LSNAAYTTGPYVDTPYLVGQCTWYAYGRIQELGLISSQRLTTLGTFLDNAADWAQDAANAGFSTGTEPQVGALAVWGSGHVAFVEGVSGTSVQVTECNNTPAVGAHVVIATATWLHSSMSTATTTRLWLMPHFTVMTVVGGPFTAAGNSYPWYELSGNGYTDEYAAWTDWTAQNAGNPATPTGFQWNMTQFQDSAGAPWLGGSPTYIYFAPAFSAFSLTRSGDAFTISYTASDAGTAALSGVELWRAPVVDGEVGTWVKLATNNASGSTASGSFAPDSPGAGTWEYGVHADDLNGNWNDESNSQTTGVSNFAPIQVTVGAAPAISSVSPTSLPPSVNRQPIVVFGTGFDTSSSHLLFTDPQGNTYTSADHPAYEWRASGEFDYLIDNNAALGTWWVQVQNPDGQLSNAVSFTVTAPALGGAIAWFNPGFGDAAGGYPEAGLICDAAGNLYGTTSGGGADDQGTVFEVAAGTHALTTLASFNDQDGAQPEAGLICDAAGNLYGTTSGGGADDQGTVFELAAGTDALTTLASFNGKNGDGVLPEGGLVADAAGDLFGTTTCGGAYGDGTVFEVAAGIHTLTMLASFDGPYGAFPEGDLVADAAGNLYGTTKYTDGSGSGLNPFEGDGTVFEVAAGTHALSTLAWFGGGAPHKGDPWLSGAQPEGGLIADAEGDLYGTTCYGGAYNEGTVFELAAGTHATTTLFSFNGSNGAQPEGSLTADAAGDLYGTTCYGGAYNGGTVFELIPGTHAFATLLTLNCDSGCNPEAGVIADAAGNLYGTAPQADCCAGTVFEVNAGWPTPRPPVVTGVSSTTPAGIYGAGAWIPITVTFSEPVTVVDCTPQLALNDGGIACYDPGASAGTALVFDYYPGPNQYTADLDYASTAALEVSGLQTGDIEDSTGSWATLTLPPTRADGLAACRIAIETVPPTLCNPPNGSTDQSTTPAFSWTPVAGASSYDIQVTTPAGDCCFWDATPAWSSDSPNWPLSAGTSYSWEVCALVGAQWGPWSSVYSFTTAPACLAAPLLIAPGSGSFPGQPVSVTQPTFQWQVVPGADQYALYIRQMNADGSQGPIVLNSQAAGVAIPGSTTVYALPSALLQDGGYYCWNMESHSAAGWSTAYSTPLYFGVAACVGGSFYNAAAAVAYAQKYAHSVCSDGYFWKGEPDDPAYLGAGQLVPTGAGVDGGVGDDCAHFVSCCIGSEPHQSGGGLTIQHYAGGASNAYGDCNAQDLVNQLINDGAATGVSSLSDLVPGDIVAFLTNGTVTHVTLYLGNNMIAQHSSTDSAIDTVVANPQVEEYIHITARQPPNLQPPTPSSTLDGTTGVPTDTPFSWSQVPDNDGYQIVASTDPNDLPAGASNTSVQPSNGFDVSVPANQTSYITPAALTAGPMYYWAVRAISSTGDWLSGLWSSVASFVTQATVPTLTITSPSAGSTYYISDGSATTAPGMPEIAATLSLDGTTQNPATTQFTWTAVVSFDPTKASDGGVTTPISYTYTCASTGPSVTITDANMWGHVIRGGDVTLTAAAWVDGAYVQSPAVKLEILGDSGTPGASTLRSYFSAQQPPADWPAGTTYQYAGVLYDIAQTESQFSQFCNGLPLYEGYAKVPSDGGVGVMQLTPPSNDEQVWDWRANASAGVAVFDDKLDAAIAHEAVDTETITTMLSDLVSEGIGYSSVELGFTPDMLVQDAVQAYHGHFAWQPSTNLSDYYPDQGGVVTVKWVRTSYAGSYEIPVLENNTADPLVATTQPPAMATAGTPFGLTVTAENADGTTNTSFAGNVTVSLMNFGESAATLGGTVAVTAVNGVATLSGLTVDQAGTYALSVTGGGMAPITTSAFDVAAMPAANLMVIGEPPGTVTAGAAFSVEVAAEDVWGNIDPTFTGSVTLSLASNPGGAALGGTLTASAVNGVATFSGLTIDQPGSGYSLQGATSAFAPATSTTINVTPVGTAAQLVVTGQPPASVTAGSGFGLTVTAEDGFGTVDAGYGGSVTVALVDASSGATLGGTLTMAAVNGVATFTDLNVNLAGSYALAITANDLDGTTANDIEVSPATATQLVVDPMANVLNGWPFDLYALAEDPYGNIDPTFGGSVTVALASNPGGAILAGTLTGTAAGGTAYFPGLTLNGLSSGCTLTATAPGLATGTSLPFSITTDQLVVTAQPPTCVVAGTGFGLTVAIEDAAGNVDTSFNGAVSVGLIDLANGGATLGGTATVTAASGIATFSGLTLDKLGTYALSVTASGVGGTTTDAFQVKATPTTTVTDASGPYDGQPFFGTASVTDANATQAASLEGVAPSLAYYAGSRTVGQLATAVPLPGVPTDAGTYTVAASFAGSADYAAAQSAPVTFTILPVPLIVTAADWPSTDVTLTVGGDGNVHVYTTGTTTDVVTPCPPVDLANIEITSPSSGTSNLTIDSTAGEPVPAGGLSYSGAGGLTITGSGIVVLSGPNGHTGGTTVANGVLAAENASAIPAGSLLVIGPQGSVVLGTPGAAEPLGLISGGGTISSSAAVPGSGAGGVLDSAAPAVSPAATSAGTVVMVLTPVLAPATEISAPIIPSGNTLAVADGAGVPGATGAVSLTENTTAHRPQVVPIASITAAGGLAFGTSAWAAIPPFIGQSGSVVVSRDAVLTAASPVVVAAGQASTPAAFAGSAVSARDHVLQAGAWAPSANEARWLDEMRSLQGRAHLVWKPDSVADALDTVLANYGR
jgi:uncharacterized repeat protein (TIGR03803 family)/autotransporter-associated beta strand protein